MVTTASFFGVELDRKLAPRPASTSEILEVFEILKPKASATPLIRVGGEIDGAYLVPDDLDGIAACFSPGVNRIKYFEDYLTDNYGIAAHMVDFSCDVDEFVTPLREGKQTFAKKWLDVVPGTDNISLDDWVDEHGSEGDLLLQIDIEGAEYRNLLGTSDETLARFRMIVLEVHNLGKMLDEPILSGAIAPFFRKLAKSFTTVHAHPNNCCGDFEVPGTDIRIPQVLELTLVRNDRFTPRAGTPLLPHPLDVGRNVPRVPPMFLSDAWCDYQRPLESRVKMLEDAQRYHEEYESTTTATEDELKSVLALTMRSLQTLSRLGGRKPGSLGELVEVAAGRPYTLSSAYDRTSRIGTIEPRDNYFFHTGFGPGQSIRVDLGTAKTVRRIELTNRRDMRQDRARHIFVELTGPRGTKRVFPLFKDGKLPGGSWQEASLEVPDIAARYVRIINPLNTALHLADLRVFAVVGDGPAIPSAPTPQATRVTRASRRIARGVRRRLRRKARRGSASSGSTRPLATRPAPPTEAMPPAPVTTSPGTELNVIDGCARFGVPIRGLIHVGANSGQEYPEYQARTTGPLLYVEAIPALAERVRQRLDPHRPHVIRQALLSDTTGDAVTFHVSSNGGASSSMFEAGRHATEYPSVTFEEKVELVTERLDDIVSERPEAADYNVILLDVQGAEFKVLQGAPDLLTQVDAVLAEVAPEPLYEGGCTFLEVTNLLAEAGLVFRDAVMTSKGWGEALYTRSKG
ncbi:FkbM family methyltransferase [Mumia sp. zg.B17]|uniref:FkbM family methyltransferase n=1 Tax=Mumia sp. zg.B17 TaxID=2855446 RepID=UPI001C6E48F4|nr:FkbM family methyltransferase [Mumia sp. zg.B17]MBW9204504.1 FkbM family methyltransferase [Mumia sp. zg.B17]